MKIVLINVTSIFGPVRAEASWPPLGILYLGTLLKQKSHDVYLFDQTAENASIETTVNWILKKDPDIVGLSTLTSSGIMASEISRLLKEQNPHIKIVWGGIHATFNDKRILSKYSSPDFIVKKEAEQNFLELVDSIEKGKIFDDIKGITFRNNGKIISTPDRPLIKDLDALPFPDRSLLKLKYTSKINEIIFSQNFTSILSSRGCPFSCNFCSCSAFADRFWRYRSPENVVDELELLVNQGYDQVVFVDDNFTLNQKRVVKICKLMKERKIKIDWFCEGRVDQSSFEMLKHMKKSGCKAIYLGIESANERILEYYNKKISLSQSKRAVRNAKKAGLNTIGTFIVGAPNESENEIKKTLSFAQKLNVDFPQFNILSITPGMPIWNELRDKGYIDESISWEKHVFIPEIIPDSIPIDKVKQMIKEAYKQFLFRRGFILEQVYKTLTNSFRIKIILRNIHNENLKNVSRMYDNVYGNQ